jgi:hypothetical protein
MPKKNWTKADERKYKAIVKSCSAGKRGKKATKTCKRIAAATVNKKKGLAGGKTWEVYQMPKTLTQLKQWNKHCGGHFFDRGAMSFFKSKIHKSIVPCKSSRCVLFVTSEQGPDNVRKFSVRKAEGCSIATTASGFQAYRSEADARAAAKQAAAKL